jgi:hypothetical protein
MRAIHEHDCDFEVVGICTCGAFNKCRRVAEGANVPGLSEHLAKLKLLRDLQRNAPSGVPTDQTPPAGGETGASV